ncbi:OLC1v1017545C1 [Oldenlandia corymbosa var. corymbosa]|uniref:OLC1v1017545C1 n=1 Tax=Oldenlandia corymbosa var. corymbosa TaxID=529605 RepID=A0AAV1E9P1_OLDCO|nr:OLC1v1017545C1 [Oldenlandia corymbosa var. corymbosa]
MAEPPPPPQQVRFGIMGCATIARKVARAIMLAPNATIVAIGSRSLEKAVSFAKENGFPATAKVYGSYDAVLDDEEVDAVYIPLPTSLHVEWAVRAAQKKKHVLLEKPVALNVKELDAILAACESSGVQFMDGTMWMHHPRTARMKEVLSDPQQLGQIKTIHSAFSFAGGPEFLKNDIRTKPDLDSLGALGDLGWYCIRAILWAFDYELPKSVTAIADPEVNDSGVILSCGASLKWQEGGRTATFYCSFLTTMVMDLTVLGTNGNLHANDYVIPVNENDATFYMNRINRIANYAYSLGNPAREETIATDLPQEALMIKEFCDLVGGIQGNGANPEKKWGEISTKTQVVLDAVKASIDNGFKPVEVVY